MKLKILIILILVFNNLFAQRDSTNKKKFYFYSNCFNKSISLLDASKFGYGSGFSLINFDFGKSIVNNFGWCGRVFMNTIKMDYNEAGKNVIRLFNLDNTWTPIENERESSFTVYSFLFGLFYNKRLKNENFAIFIKTEFGINSLNYGNAGGVKSGDLEYWGGGLHGNIIPANLTEFSFGMKLSNNSYFSINLGHYICINKWKISGSMFYNNNEIRNQYFTQTLFLSHLYLGLGINFIIS